VAAAVQVVVTAPLLGMLEPVIDSRMSGSHKLVCSLI
jgi:hypothetical protein